jgi:hypothetical protein
MAASKGYKLRPLAKPRADQLRDQAGRDQAGRDHERDLGDSGQEDEKCHRSVETLWVDPDELAEQHHI